MHARYKKRKNNYYTCVNIIAVDDLKLVKEEKQMTLAVVCILSPIIQKKH